MPNSSSVEYINKLPDWISYGTLIDPDELVIALGKCAYLIFGDHGIVIMVGFFSPSNNSW
jgi:hypothetical protein